MIQAVSIGPMRMVAGLTFSFFLCGCSGEKPSGGADVELAPAAGVINYNGKPLANATLSFYPEKGPVGVGRSNEQGEFVVKTNGSSGAPIGKLTVTVTVAAAAGADEFPEADGTEIQQAKKAAEKLPAKYGSQADTDIIITLPAEGNEALKIDLTK